MDLSPDEDNFPGRLLHQAALWDNLELLQELIANGTPVDARDSSARTALHAAALGERSRCLQALCAAGADVNAQQDEGSGGKTALHIAAERGHVENIKVLISANAALSTLDCGGDTALALAERGSHRYAAHALREARDAIERDRLSQHSLVREIVVQGDGNLLRGKLTALGSESGLIVNLAPGGANTLLYTASESGHTPTVKTLLEFGADGRAHPVTRYSPLYIACYHGHLDIANTLLTHFPSSAQQETVERWLPIHAACIGGHAELVTTLLEFPYPETMMKSYKDPISELKYEAAFDINAVDVSGQTPLYVACTLGNLPVVEALLNHTVCAVKDEDTVIPENVQQVLSPTRTSISLGIHAIVSKLTGQNSEKHSKNIPKLRPLKIHGEALGAAVRGGHFNVTKRLLAAGADPDVILTTHTTQLFTEPEQEGRSRKLIRGSRASSSPSPGRYGEKGSWSPLSLAARDRNTQLVELLLSYGATDPHNLALTLCSQHGLMTLVAAILATKAYPDPDYKINKSVVSESVFSRDGDSMLTYSALCPSTPVMINWRDLHCLPPTIRMKWIRDAALKVNPRLGSEQASLHAITRIDISNNELKYIPAELLTLVSLKYLNVAQNKLERLPTLTEPFEEEESSGFLSKRGKKNSKKNVGYTAPVLEELYLQDNRLEELPACIFSLPSLTVLDVSNNKLHNLPVEMWSSRTLRDLNVALNHLRDLPFDNQSGSTSPSPCPSTSDVSTSPSTSTNFIFPHYLKSESRTPSVERSLSETVDEEDEHGIPVFGNRSGNAVWSNARRVHTWRHVSEAWSPPPRKKPCPPLASLNLSHNQFTQVPPVLACRAPGLLRLNMAYNSLRSMSYVTSYPTSLRQLDLSHNEITCWPSLPQVENFGSNDQDPLACYCANGSLATRLRPRSGGSVRSQLLSAACPARRHLRLESLRTLREKAPAGIATAAGDIVLITRCYLQSALMDLPLLSIRQVQILANNLLTRIQLTTADDSFVSSIPHDGSTEDDDDWNTGSNIKGRLTFPLLSMLDVSSNLLRCIPPAIHELNNLSVLNISGNKDITDLPPQMGLLSRLWNLNTSGCPLHEPLRSMVACGKYKSMDIVGYLKSVLQEAQPYARMKLMLVGVQGIGKTSLLECLRQESTIVHRRKPTEHWAKRMGNKSARKGGNLSTVGVDIGSWVYEKHRSSKGPVTFRTWDFGGQQEYYATHQYFLSRRSLYLVVWKITDGRKGLAGAVQWLRSIQARAPGSPVIIVATHYDQVGNCNLPESESPEGLQRLIRTSIMGAPDADKLGLPRVHDSVEVSCNTRHNIRLLADIIYSVAFGIKPPGSKEPLLEQRVPATYLNLEECVIHLANELKEPVVKHDEYKRLVTQYMQQKSLRTFRDAAELHQATMFLHENGVILHYDDATLKELYFLRPQWLCDLLAHVVTVREINPFASNGIMKVEDLSHVFKASPLLARSGDEASSLALSLLNKFELALCWDVRCLLVPPLLGSREPSVPQLALRSRCWPGGPRGTPRRVWCPAGLTVPHLEANTSGTDSPKLINESLNTVTIHARECNSGLRRILLMSYVPRGFWPRLVTRMLADDVLADSAPLAYRLPNEMEVDEATTKALDLNWSWKLWKTGIKLVWSEMTLLSVRQVGSGADDLPTIPAEDDVVDDALTHVRFRVRQDGNWCDLEVSSSACIEILLPAQVCVARREDGLPIAGYQSISLEPNPETLAKLLAVLSDHVDLLLEDWYPSLGTRFVHTSEGRCLITRLVPCNACLKQPAHDCLYQFNQAFRRLEVEHDIPRRARHSQESRASDGDSGVGAESAASSRMGSVEGVIARQSAEEVQAVSYAWTVEECILSACTNVQVHCPVHGEVKLRDVAPDTAFLDVEESHRARWDSIRIGTVVGRGAFGTVVRGNWCGMGTAVKLLQPHPPADSNPVHVNAYKAALSRWDREPSASACRAYCGLRQELSVLSSLRHHHVVPLLAVCSAPLALLLALANMGALDGVLRDYRGCGVRIGVRVARALALQVARALEYLHTKRIVYRDLKAENVLVWSMPKPQEAAAAETSTSAVNVHVKLGDYGISRLAPPSGTKGFGGTEGFMAPEIMRYNGEEEYNEKVDCFSYGMLLYEVLTLRQPFEGHEAVKEAVLDGARPALTPKDLQYPCCILESMRRCWSSAPSCRPSAAALVSLAAAPEYPALQDAAVARGDFAADHTLVANVTDEGVYGWEIWCGGGDERIHTYITTRYAFTHVHTLKIHPGVKGESVKMTSGCRIGNTMWIGDSSGRITVYSSTRLAVLWSVIVHESVGGGPSPISALYPLNNLQKVALSTLSGRLFLVTSERPEGEGSFVLTELGTASELCCLAAVPRGQGWEVWAGGQGLYAYKITNSGVCTADTLTDSRVTLLAASNDSIYSYCEPGCVVQQWSVKSREVTARLDCSKLVPCSESLQSIAIDEHLSLDNCQVTALCCNDGLVYCGTAWGCLIVAEAETLRPVTVFRPYEESVLSIIPLSRYPGDSGPMIATLGKGYRPLLQRYAPAQSNSTNSWPGNYCLLWAAGYWLPD